MIKKEGITFERPMSSDYYRVIQATPDQQGKITIPATVDGRIVKQIAAGAFQGITRLFNIEIPDCVEDIGNSAFQNCQNLKKVIFYPTDNTADILQINRQAFAQCYQLEKFCSTTPLFLCEEAFYKCKMLKDLITTIAYCSFRSFGDCKNLSEVAFSENAQWVGSSFVDCNSLATIIFNGAIGESTLNTPSSLNALKDKLFICNRNFPQLDLVYDGFKIKIV